MDHAGRMQLVGRITYYVGWVALVCGGLFHINVAKGSVLGSGFAAAESV
jgi:hypothetical protein